VNNTTSGCPTSVDTVYIKIREIKAQFTSDSLLCNNVGNPFDASLSQDVYSECWGGYTWQFDRPNLRPITTTDANYPIELPVTGDVEVTLIVKDLNDCRDTAQVHLCVCLVWMRPTRQAISQFVPRKQITMNKYLSVRHNHRII
jgi:hypothetical protein